MNSPLIQEEVPDVSSPPQGDIFYGVCLPPELVSPEEGSLVFTDRAKALKVVRKHKAARFKTFPTEEEALRFVESCRSLVLSSEGSSSVGAGERPSPFKAPRPQEMVRLRKVVESGDLGAAAAAIEENPRYLVSSGDTPAILQEGSRYNALHVAAKCGHRDICSYLLEKVSCPDFIRKLYGDLSDTSCDIEDRCKVLLDLYLNTPDKALNETPLHFASKMGAVDVVALLLSFPQCDKNRQNKFGNTPFDVICSRAKNNDVSVKKEIETLLGEQYFVPVLRVEDFSLQAVVGEPFLISSPPEPSPGVGVESRLTVKAIAGPMGLESAIAFRRKWKKTPPRREGAACGRPILKLPTLYDPDKGLECVGRQLAQEEKINWSEYWSFLDSFTNLKTEEGLRMLENYLNNRFKEALPNQISRSTNESSNLDCSLKRERKCPRAIGTPKSHSKLDLSLTPLSELCRDFKKLSLSSELPGNSYEGRSGTALEDDSGQAAKQQANMDKLCQVYAKKLVDSLLKRHSKKSDWVNGVRNAVSYIHSCLGNCREDERFSSVPMNRAHSRVARMSRNHLICRQTDDEQVLNILNDILGSVLARDDYDTHPAGPLECILASLRKDLFRSAVEEEGPPGRCVPPWSSEEGCGCRYPTSTRARRNNLSYGHRRNLLVDICTCEEEQSLHGLEPSDIDYSSPEDSDSSGSDSDTFLTPPSSPNFSSELSSSSDDESDMFLPDEGPDVFIIGDKPSKLDAAVLDAISSAILTHEKYPNIYRWKHLCSLVIKSTVKESWPSPSLKELKRKVNRADSSSTTPSWHRSHLLFSLR